MPENDLAHDLNGCSRSGGIGGGMSSQVVGPEADSDEFSCFFYDYSCCRIGNAKDLLFLFNPSLPDMFPEAVCQLLRCEGNLRLTTTLGRLNAYSPPVNVRGGQFEHFPDSHPSSCHQFQDEPVSLVLSSEDDLIDGFLFHDLPGDRPIVFEDLSKHGCVTRIGEPLRARVYDEGEEGPKKGKAESFGGLFEPLGQVT